MQNASSVWRVIRNNIEDYPAITTLLGLILLGLIPYFQYQAWILDGIHAASQALQTGKDYFEHGDYDNAIFEYATAYQFYERPLIDSKSVLDGKLQLAQGYHQLMVMQTESYGSQAFQTSFNLYTDLFTSRSHSLEGLAGLKALTDLRGFTTGSRFATQSINEVIENRYSDASLQQNPQRKKEAARFYYLLGNEYMLQVDILGAIQAYKQAVKLDPEESLYQKAEQKVNAAGDASDIIQTCQNLLVKDPQNPTYHMCLIQAYRKNGQTVELLRAYENMLTVLGNATNIQLEAAREYYEWGRIQSSRGQFEAALHAYQRAFELSPTAEVYKQSAQAQIVTLNISITVQDATGNPIEAAIAFVDEENIGRSDAVGRIETAISYLSIGNLQVDVFSQEHGFYHTDIPVTPDQTSYFVRANLSLDLDQDLEYAKRAARTGRSDLAENLYTILVQRVLDTNDPRINNNVCWNGSLDGFVDLVLPACERAVRLAPENGIYADSHGLAIALKGNFPRAIDDFTLYVQWEEKTTDPDLEQINQRKEWIVALEAGHNPFDSALLNELRGQ